MNRHPSLIELDPNIPPATVAPDRIYAALKHQILTCSLPPGKKLVEKDLAERLGVSRTPLREALNRLALENLVWLAPYRGYAVTAITTESIRNLLELRGIVESESAALAAERGTAEEIQEMTAKAELRYKPGDRKTYERYLRANSAFHFAVVRASHNAELAGVVMSVLDQLQRPLYLGLDVGLDTKAATAEHVDLVQAIQRHDPVAARRIMAEQIRRAEGRILAVVSAINRPAGPAVTKKSNGRSTGARS